MDQFDCRGDVDDVLCPLAAKSQESQEGDHRSNPLATAVNQMSSNVRQNLLTGTDGALEIVFDELELVTHIAEWIATPLKRGNLAFDAGGDRGNRLQ